MSQFKEHETKAWMDLIAWVKICKERIPMETNLTQFLLSVASGCSFLGCPLYLLLNITGSYSCNWKLHKGSSQQKEDSIND
jgi:hypothetical protein